MEKFIPEITYTPVDFDPFAGEAIERTVPSTEAQREVFIASQMGTEASCAYNESVSLELKGALDVAALENSLTRLVQRHEALRGCMSPDGMRVIVHEHSEIKLQHIDLSDLPAAERARKLQALSETDMTTPFDLLNGPVFRAQLIKLAPEEHLLRLTGHHVLADGWSLGIMMADISGFTIYSFSSVVNHMLLSGPFLRSKTVFP